VKSSDKKVQLTMSENQARTIISALDLYSRLGIGQVDRVKEVLDRDFGRWKGDSNDIKLLLRKIKDYYFPEFKGGNGYFGIFQESCPEESKISWDLIQVIRYALAWHNNPAGGMTVDFGEPLRSSLKEDLANVKIKE